MEINLADKNGKTPLMLAQGRKHRELIDYLRKEARSRSNLIPKLDLWWVVLYG